MEGSHDIETTHRRHDRKTYGQLALKSPIESNPLIATGAPLGKLIFKILKQHGNSHDLTSLNQSQNKTGLIKTAIPRS